MSEPMPAERLAEVREHTVRCALAFGAVGLSEAEAEREDLLAEVDRLLERDARIHEELRDRRSDDLNVRGTLCPQPGTAPDPMIPFELGSTITPVVEWLVGELERLRAAKPGVRVIDPAVVEQLLGMHKIAKTVGGYMPEDHPARAVSIEFTAQLQQLVDDGFTVHRIAKCLGLTHQAIHSRLARHGYRDPSPSQAYAEYRGVQSRGPGPKKAGAR